MAVPPWLLVIFTAILAAAAIAQAISAHRQASANERLSRLTEQYVELTHGLLAETRAASERESARERAAAAGGRATLRQHAREAIAFLGRLDEDDAGGVYLSGSNASRLAGFASMVERDLSALRLAAGPGREAVAEMYQLADQRRVEPLKTARTHLHKLVEQLERGGP